MALRYLNPSRKITCATLKPREQAENARKILDEALGK